MSTAEPKTFEHKVAKYTAQNRGGPLTVAQQRQLRRTKSRAENAQRRAVHRETRRNRRAAHREWLRGLFGRA